MDTLLSHQQHDCRLHDKATTGQIVSQVLSGNDGTMRERADSGKVFSMYLVQREFHRN